MLGDTNDPGTYYEAIWDTGGTDEIRYDGLCDARIDLLAATLDYSPTGGGAISFVDDIWGGYTIANGVVIENATGGDGNDVILGAEADNVLSGRNGDDTLLGREGSDTVNGGNGLDELHGGADGDDLSGGNGNDVLLGDDGDDALFGDNGDDILNGGAGDDTMTGGKGVDTFVFADLGGTDVLTDFKHTQDIIDLSQLDAIDGGAVNPFSWIGSAAFSGAAGELRAYSVAGSNYLAGDTDGDMVADFIVQTNILLQSSDIYFG